MRFIFLAVSLITVAASLLLLDPGSTQTAGSFVVLQGASPGTSQGGSTNISGTSRAAQFIGGGTGLTGVNADLLDGINSTSFLQAVPNPLTLSGSQPSSHIIKGINTNSAADSMGFYGQATATSGATVGVRGDSSSPDGLGLYGRATSGFGSTFGVWGQAASSSGTGMHGVATHPTGSTFGVYGRVDSQNGVAVYALNSAAGAGYGVKSEVAGSTGTAIYGLAYNGSGSTVGVKGEVTSSASSVSGVFGYAPNGGWGVRGWGRNRGVTGYATGNSGGASGAEFDSADSTGYGVVCFGDLRLIGDLSITGSKGGYVSDLVRNGGVDPLEPGDVVEIIGNDTAVMGDVPVIVVRKCSKPDSRAVLGPIDCSVALRPADDQVESKNLSARPRYDTAQFHVHKQLGQIKPGGYGRAVTLGSFKTIKVDASFGAIQPGDLLVSSPTPGHAMRSDDPRIGTVIGKALGSHDSGVGTIPVLVQSR